MSCYIHYTSLTLTKVDRNYHTMDVEALAVVWVLRKLNFFILNGGGVRRDHLFLATLSKRTSISNRVLRWALEIQQYLVRMK